MAVELGGLDQAHDRGRTLAGTQTPGEEPVLPPGGNRANAILDPIVVDRHLTIAKIMDQCGPALQAVVKPHLRRSATRCPSGDCLMIGTSDVGAMLYRSAKSGHLATWKYV